MPIFGARFLPFSAGIVIGAAAHAAYPRLKEKYGAQVKETLGPIVAAAAAGASDAMSEAVRAVSEKAGEVREAMAAMPTRNGPAQHEHAGANR